MGEPQTRPEDEEVVFVPSQRVQTGDPEWVLEMRHDPEGRVGLLVFTSLDLLVAGCGEHQPWIAVPASRVEELGEEAGAEVILVDVMLEPGQRHLADERQVETVGGEW